MKVKKKLAPGQYEVSRLQILDLGYQPEINIKEWKLEIVGGEKPLKLSLEELKKLGVKEYTEQFACVTSWSRLNTPWKGIPFENIIKFAKPKNWKHLIQYGKDDYSTNATREDIEKGNVFLAFELDGKPIPRENGYVRIIIPHLYGWKSSKFLYKIEFSPIDKPGYWEVRGYHNRGRVDEEERLG